MAASGWSTISGMIFRTNGLNIYSMLGLPGRRRPGGFAPYELPRGPSTRAFIKSSPHPIVASRADSETSSGDKALGPVPGTRLCPSTGPKELGVSPDGPGSLTSGFPRCRVVQSIRREGQPGTLLLTSTYTDLVVQIRTQSTSTAIRTWSKSLGKLKSTLKQLPRFLPRAFIPPPLEHPPRLWLPWFRRWLVEPDGHVAFTWHAWLAILSNSPSSSCFLYFTCVQSFFVDLRILRHRFPNSTHSTSQIRLTIPPSP